MLIESLDVRDFELNCMRELAPLLGRSPRALKRFVNTYRLTKASLSDSERTAFVRGGKGATDFEAVLFLLAIDCGMPSFSPVLFDVLRQLGVEGDRKGRSAKRIGTEQNPWIAAVDRDKRTNVSRDWRRIKQWLGGREESDGGDFDAERLARWVPRVARYSFSAPVS